MTQSSGISPDTPSEEYPKPMYLRGGLLKRMVHSPKEQAELGDDWFTEPQEPTQ